MAHRTYRFVLDIPPDKYLKFYQGSARSVFTYDLQGRSLRFPAGSLRRFVTHDGVRGLFEMEVDGNDKLVELRKVREL